MRLATLDKRVWCTATLVMLLTAGTAIGEAQELAGTFDQLRVLVKPGDTIRVTDRAGRELTGRISELSPSSLALLVDGTRHELPESDVMTIRQRRSDSLANGAKWGFAIGFGLGLLTGFGPACFPEEDDCPYDPALGLLSGAAGGALYAAIGAGIDAMISRTQVIYTKPAAPPAVRVTPMLTRQRKGVLLSLAF